MTGTLATMGSWTQMRTGCNTAPHLTIPVGSTATLRSGGRPTTEDEFLHNICRGYDTSDPTKPTSMW